MSARVHGMGHELVAPDWPPLTLPEVREVLRSYGLAARSIVWSSPRPLSAAALVDVSDGTVFVKRHAAVVRNAPALEEEHAFAAHLLARGVAVPQVLAADSGATATTTGPWTWEVHAQGAGDDLYRDVLSWEPFARADHAFAAGAVLARIADAATDFDAPARGPHLLVTSWQAIGRSDLQAGLDEFVSERPLLEAALRSRDWHADIERVLLPLHDRLMPHLPALPSQWTHGDGHASNFLWRAGEVACVLDLGLADRTTPLVDLATAIERNCVSWLDDEPAVRHDHVDALLAGWSSVRPLSADDAAELAALLPLVHVEFALSELAYFAGVTQSAANADLAYESYLLGHARWFTGQRGTELLEQLG